MYLPVRVLQGVRPVGGPSLSQEAVETCALLTSCVTVGSLASPPNIANLASLADSPLPQIRGGFSRTGLQGGGFFFTDPDRVVSELFCTGGPVY